MTISKTHAANIAPRIHRPIRTCARPGTSHPPEQMAIVAAIFIGFNSPVGGLELECTWLFACSITRFALSGSHSLRSFRDSYRRVSVRGRHFPSLQFEKFCVYCFLPATG